MTDEHPTASVRTKSQHRSRLPLIWAIPVVTVIIGAWLAWSTISRRGPLITITFETAEGLQANLSHVKHKDVDMGVVEKIVLTKDLKGVEVTVRMNREAEPLLTDKAQFWVVRPRFFAGAISGLQTLFSGSYIDLLPAASGGEPTRTFAGLENPPVLQSDVPGRTFLLRAKRIGSLNLGSPIMFRDLEVGEILGWDVGEMARDITVHAFVRAPFDKYVHDNSRFWNASGATVQLGPNGLKLQIESLRAVVLGGIAFETPDDPNVTAESQANRPFQLYETRDAADSSTYHRSLPMIANFSGSVSGLAAGSPVTLRGLKIGEVTAVSLLYDHVLDNVLAPVRFTLEPGRIAMLDLPTDGDLDAKMRDLVRRGLRVKLESSNILTGQKQLVLDLYKDAGAGELGKDGDAYVLPVLGGESDDIATAASNLVNRISAMPFESIGKNLDQSLAGVNALVNDKELAESVTELKSTLASTRTLVNNLNHGMTPVMQRLPTIANNLESAVQHTDKLIGSLQTGYGGDSHFSRDVTQLMSQLSDAARSIRVLADLLSRHPEALIRGRTDQGAQ
jgi:paraquat-inducible protein B